jgi:hypothetical protein
MVQYKSIKNQVYILPEHHAQINTLLNVNTIELTRDVRSLTAVRLSLSKPSKGVCQSLPSAEAKKGENKIIT